MYASDGRDKLERSGLIKGLVDVGEQQKNLLSTLSSSCSPGPPFSAGWSEEDAHKVFHEVDIFNTGYISIQQFENWWLKDVKHHDVSSLHIPSTNSHLTVSLCSPLP